MMMDEFLTMASSTVIPDPGFAIAWSDSASGIIDGNVFVRVKI